MKDIKKSVAKFQKETSILLNLLEKNQRVGIDRMGLPAQGCYIRYLTSVEVAQKELTRVIGTGTTYFDTETSYSKKSIEISQSADLALSAMETFQDKLSNAQGKLHKVLKPAKEGITAFLEDYTKNLETLKENYEKASKSYDETATGLFSNNNIGFFKGAPPEQMVPLLETAEAKAGETSKPQHSGYGTFSG